ncbi:MAG: fibronectin type III domain-containing protein [Candidatus Sericytochromatia bacterium]
MKRSTTHPRLLATLMALSLSSTLAACGPAPVSTPQPSASTGAAPSPDASGSPAASPSPDTVASDELTVDVKADASLTGFATTQETGLTLCLSQIASATTRLMLPAGLPEAALNAMRSNGATVETVNGQLTATVRRELTLQDLLNGITFRLRGVPGGTIEGRTTFFNAAGNELGFVSWRADVSSGKNVSVQLKAGSDTHAGESCPKIDASVSGATFLGAGGQVVGNQPLPNPVTTPSPTPTPSASTAPGAAPTAPLNVHVVEQTSTSLTLQWEFPADARSFRLFLDGTQVASDYVTPNYYRFEGLRESTTYRLGVQSVNDSGVSEIVTLSTATLGTGHSGTGNFSGGGSSRPRTRSSDTIVAGDEFLINQSTNASVSTSSAAMDDDGNFVVVWADLSSNVGDIKARLFDQNGDPLSSEFIVNSYTSGTQIDPDVAMDGDGNFVVVWTGAVANDDAGVSGKVFSAGSTVGGSEFQINEYTVGPQQSPSVAMDADGDFVTAWNSLSQDGYSGGIYARHYSAGSTEGSSEFHVNQNTSRNEIEPDVAMDADGDFVITWTSKYLSNPCINLCINIQPLNIYGDVMARSYQADSTTGATEFMVSENDAALESGQAIAMAADGAYTIVWSSSESFGFNDTIRGKSFAAGSNSGDTFVVGERDSTTGIVASPKVALDDPGNFVVTWHQVSPGETTQQNIMARRYSAGAATAGTEFRVNVYTTISASSPDVAMDADGDFVFSWFSGDHPLTYNNYTGLLGRYYTRN